MSQSPRILNFAFVCCLIIASFVACQPESGGNSETANAPSEVDAPEAHDVTYEPAYPADVSTEGLTSEDVSQQEAAGSHDHGEDHAHGDEGDHSHDGDHSDHGEDHAHGDDGDHDESDHSHGPEGDHAHESAGEHSEDDHDH